MTKILIDEATVKLALKKIKAARDCHPNAVDTLLFEAEEILEEALAEQPARQCKWPTCQSEEAQQALAEQLKRELVGEQPAQQEPVPWSQALEGVWAESDDTTPQPAQRKPLTINEVEHILAQHNYEIHGDRARYIVRMTEAVHGIKENT